MKQYTHLSISIGLGSIIMLPICILHGVTFLFILFPFVFGLLGKVNDWLDFKLYSKHQRKFLTHSPFSPLLLAISILMGLTFSFIGPFFGIFVGITTHFIFLGHFFLDSLNPSGVPVMPKTKFGLKKIPYDSLRWNFLFFLAGLGMLMLSILLFANNFF